MPILKSTDPIEDDENDDENAKQWGELISLYELLEDVWYYR